PLFFFSSRRRHTRSYGDWSSDVCSSDLALLAPQIFSTVAEYPLAIVLALLLRPGPLRARPGVLRRYADVLLPFAVLVGILVAARSEERRVGKGCSCRRGVYEW